MAPRTDRTTRIPSGVVFCTLAATISAASDVSIPDCSKPQSPREGDTLKYFTDFCLKNGSSQAQNPALTVLFVPNSLGSGSYLSGDHFGGVGRLHPRLDESLELLDINLH